MKDNIKEYRERAISQMIDDIKYLEKNGLDAEDIWDDIDIHNYSNYATEEDKVKAFRKAGYTVDFN